MELHASGAWTAVAPAVAAALAGQALGKLSLSSSNGFALKAAAADGATLKSPLAAAQLLAGAALVRGGVSRAWRASRGGRRRRPPTVSVHRAYGPRSALCQSATATARRALGV